AGQPRRLEPDERDTLERVDLGTPSADLEVAGDDVDLHVEVADRADVGEHGLVGVVREGEDHALDTVLYDALAQARGTTEKEGQPFREVVAEGRGPVVDEPDELDAVLTMVEELHRKLLSDEAVPADPRILGIAGEMAAQCARDGAQRRDQEDSEEPEDAEPAEHRLDEMRCHTEQREHPYADGYAAEHADDVVDRRVIGPLLVSVVEALEPEQEDPEREGQEQGQVLHPGADPVRRRARVGHEQACEHERQNEARDIREQQRTADELAAPIPSPFGRLLDRQLECANQIYREVVADTPAFNSKALAHPSPFPTPPRGCR